jgi:hypothetical protein
MKGILESAKRMLEQKKPLTDVYHVGTTGKRIRINVPARQFQRLDDVPVERINDRRFFKK